MPVFYAPDILQQAVLPEEESLHAVKVLRLKTGDEISVVDGIGGFYRARISRPHMKHCEVEIIERLSEKDKRDYRLHVAIAPTKNIDRLEWFIEKATEIGIDEITPLLTHHSERKIIKPERLEKIIVSASKQSLKSFFPVLNPLTSFSDLLKKQAATQRFIAHCYNGDKKLLQHVCNKGGEVLILIGPEGDFSEEEVQQALASGFVPVTLGDSRLRTETAGVVAVATVQFANQQ